MGKEDKLPLGVPKKYFGIDSEAVPFTEEDKALNTEAATKANTIKFTGGSLNDIVAAEEERASLHQQLSDKYQPTKLGDKSITNLDLPEKGPLS